VNKIRTDNNTLDTIVNKIRTDTNTLDTSEQDQDR
jgi:hypothetical protein